MKQVTANIYIKGLAVISLILVIFTTTFLSVTAQSIMITTNVPDTISLNVEIVGRGQIILEDYIIDKSMDIFMPRHKKSQLAVKPDKGYVVAVVSYNGEPLVAYETDEEYELPEITKNSTLKIKFEKMQGNPLTGDNTRIELYVCVAIISVLALAVIVLRRKSLN